MRTDMVNLHSFSSSKLGINTGKKKKKKRWVWFVFIVQQGLLQLYSLPVLSTGVMNHVDKDGRPDFLKGADVKLEPGERTQKAPKLASIAHLSRPTRG